VTHLDQLALPDARELADKVIKEGRRINKIPWTCSGAAQMIAIHVLNSEGITIEETMEETIARKEEKI
jgi:hypothetical protein